MAHFAPFATAGAANVEDEDEHAHDHDEKKDHGHRVRDNGSQVEFLDCRLNCVRKSTSSKIVDEFEEVVIVP